MKLGQSVDSLVRHEVYRFFLDRGRPPVPAELAVGLGMDQSAVEDSLRRLADDHALVLAPGTPYVWMANPLSALPTPFSVEASGRTWFGNCIWDALGVVAMLGVPGQSGHGAPTAGNAWPCRSREAVFPREKGSSTSQSRPRNGGTISGSTERTCSSSGRKST